MTDTPAKTNTIESEFFRFDNSFPYYDLLHSPRHVSRRHAPMTALARAAIFSPYAALTGFEGQIEDARQYRCNRILLSEEELAPIQALLSVLKKKDHIAVTYFQYDPGTDGQGGMAEGEYVSLSGKVAEIIPAYKKLRLLTQTSQIDIIFDNIISMKKIS